jgi:hypothetical protein
VLYLVFTDWHISGFIEENVSSLEHGIIHEPHVDVGAVLFGFVFELGHPFYFTNGGDAVKDPGEFSMFMHVGLDKYLALFRRKTTSKEYQSGFEDPVLVFFHRVFYSDGMIVDDAEDAIVFFHKIDPVANGADVITEMDFTCRLYTAKNPFHALLREIIALIYTKGPSNPSKMCVERTELPIA